MTRGSRKKVHILITVFSGTGLHFHRQLHTSLERSISVEAVIFGELNSSEGEIVGGQRRGEYNKLYSESVVK